MSNGAGIIVMLAAQVIIYIAACKMAPKEKKIGKAAFFWTILVISALPALDYLFVRPGLTAENVELYGLLRIFIYTVLTPIVTAMAFKFRVNDAGIDRGAAYLGIIPTVSLFAAIYLLFQDRAYEVGEPGH